MPIQLCTPSNDGLTAAGNVEAELSVLDVMDGGAPVDAAFTFPSIRSMMPIGCCSLADF
ncbi:hypothetical protein NLX83_25560 [Allokutzneria sp. A3M-2-11 16]|uniref:hypothetical protein n=1 Tax=Allokutzneria sp. A3M-2-11 16 TaxID=2962043 RepID=UPI0020B826AE|nr:hypothetical protein [Allokutzneria sp. A3M-2-11 16]MCP3802645.1 hypothetical protein [Allokutzneria sp. A3M-2-11 16]